MTGKDVLSFLLISLAVNLGDIIWHLFRHTPRTELCSIQNLIIVAMSVILIAIRSREA